MIETEEHRLKRLRMRSWRRGTKEMDLILGPFADEKLAGLHVELLDLYEGFLAENDHDLYSWVSGLVAVPQRYGKLTALIREYHRIPLTIGDPEMI